MSLASLAGTTWQIKENFSASTFPYTDEIGLSLGTYINMVVNNNHDHNVCGVIEYELNTPYYWEDAGWATQILSQMAAGDVIKITSGADVDNSDLIAWFEANAIQLNTTTSEEVEIRYKGNTINSLNEDSLIYLQTAGKFVEDNIRVRYRRPYLGEVSQEDGLVYFSEDGIVKAVVDESDVNFIDYDGTILYSYSKEEFANLTEMPRNPYHQGLTAQGWNWSLSDAKTYVASFGNLWIGQMYITDDGDTRIYIHLDEERLSPYLTLGINGTVEIDWGDGTTNTVTGSNINTAVDTLHNYNVSGDYIILISVTGSAQFLGHYSYGSRVLWKNATTVGNENRVYQEAIKKVFIGSNIKLGTQAFYYCCSLKTVTIPNTIISIDQAAFSSCNSLISATIPNNITTINQDLFNGCFSLIRVSLPNNITSFSGSVFRSCYFIREVNIPATVTSIGGGVFYNCFNIKNITMPNAISDIGNQTFLECHTIPNVILPNAITSIQDSTFYICYCLKNVEIPSNVTSIGTKAFYRCSGLRSIKFLPSTPPTVSNSDAWIELASDCILYVPADSFCSYQYGTNYPSVPTYTYIGYKTYANNTNLPDSYTQTFSGTTEIGSITWYATKQDAINSTNAITKGNGNEIYGIFTQSTLIF